jgi:CBS-domain-containing membrane protein
MIVQEVMTREPFTASATASVRQVLRMMTEADVRHLPILDEHTLVGIVSDRDLRAVAPDALEALEQPRQAERLLSQPIAGIMNTDVIYVHPESELGEAADLMIEHKVGALPVVEPDSLKLLGIVSYVDVLRAAREAL